jgi:hypothetical protein
VWLTTHHRKKRFVTKILKKPRTWTDSFDKRPKQKKMDMRFGTWNVGSMYRAGSLGAVGEEISKVYVRFSGRAGGQMGRRWH